MKNIMKTVFAGIFTLVFFAACDMGNKTAFLDILSQKEVGAPEKIAAVNLISGERRKNVKEEVFNALGIAAGNMTASDAAKKIAAASNTTVDGIAFEENRALAYDDKDGTFIVSVKGTKDGVRFETRIEANGFTHPYINTSLGGVIYKERYLIFDKAIEKNLPLETFITEANNTNGIGYVSFEYTLNGNDKTVTIGNNSAYSLTASFSRNRNNTIKLTANYSVILRTYPNFEGKEGISKNNFSSKVIKDDEKYFEEKDVFDYILNKVKNDTDFIKAYSDGFASEYYARAIMLNQAGNLFDETKIKEYKDLYEKDGGHIKIEDITAAVYNIRNGGINADDYKGELTVTYYIAKKDLVTEYNVNKISKTHTVIRSGFKTIKKNALTDSNGKKILTFSIGKNNGKRDKWLDKEIKNAALIDRNTGAIKDDYSDWFNLKSEVLNNNDTVGYHLILNGESYSSMLPSAQEQFLIKTQDTDQHILIQRLILSKDKGNENLNIEVLFMGGDENNPVKFSIKPNHY
ncbi:hypothetical protein [Treponema pedis]|uniref:hypothetical protein n=1 Tax=Treponema pedis TaxID=409322 RepID=UPI001980C899|nr:hypothetical protein [Treponema pedis]QSI03815.1 hypothetical protein DYQ05_02215 [Treponema pedis]